MSSSAIAGLVIALFLPWVAGYVWVESIRRLTLGWPAHESMRRPVVSVLSLKAISAGYGYFFGVFLTALIMRAWHVLGMHLDFLSLAGLLVGVVFVGWLVRRYRVLSPSGEVGARLDLALFRDPVVALLMALFVTLIVARFVTLGLEIWWRPLYAWDAWAAWAHKTRVWYELKELVPFLPPNQWPITGERDLYVAGASNYPATVPLIQVWTLLGYGEWDDSVMNLPWLLCLVALGLAFYGQANAWGLGPLPSVIATYFLVSLPLLNTHVALAGYADVWVAATFGLATMALLHWVRDKSVWQGFLALLAAGSLPFIKVEGVVWMLTLLPAVLVAVLPRRSLFLLLAVGVALLVVVLGVGIDVEIDRLGYLIVNADRLSVPGFVSVDLGYHPESVQSIFSNLYLWGNWHLFWYVIPLMLLVALLRCGKDDAVLAGCLVAIAGLAFLIFMFVFTNISKWSVSSTAVNRVLLHMIPALLFFAIVALPEKIYMRHVDKRQSNDKA